MGGNLNSGNDKRSCLLSVLMNFRLNLHYLLDNEKFAHPDKRGVDSIGKLKDSNLPGTDKVTSGAESPSTALEDTRQGFVSIGVTESHSCNNTALNCGRKLSGGKCAPWLYSNYIRKFSNKLPKERLPVARHDDICVRAGVDSRRYTVGHRSSASCISSCEGGGVVDAGEAERPCPEGTLQISLEPRTYDSAECTRLSGSTGEVNGDICAILSRFDLFNDGCCKRGGGSENESGGE